LISLGSFLAFTKSTAFGAAFVHGESCAFVLSKNGVGSVFWAIFTNASGHPDSKVVKAWLLSPAAAMRLKLIGNMFLEIF
jgi:hypothetical protein